MKFFKYVRFQTYFFCSLLLLIFFLSWNMETIFLQIIKASLIKDFIFSFVASVFITIMIYAILYFWNKDYNKYIFYKICNGYGRYDDYTYAEKIRSIITTYTLNENTKVDLQINIAVASASIARNNAFIKIYAALIIFSGFATEYLIGQYESADVNFFIFLFITLYSFYILARLTLRNLYIDRILKYIIEENH